MNQMENQEVNKWSVQSIINTVENISSPWWKHNMDDIYGDKGGIPYPAIEELSWIHFKLDSKVKIQQTKQECEQMLNKLRQLGIGQVEIYKVMGIGKFIVIELTNRVLVDSYNNYKQFVNNNQVKINQIYESVNKQVPPLGVNTLLCDTVVPKEFIAHSLFFKNN